MFDTLKIVNETAAFNRWAGFEVVRAEKGEAELRMPWRDEMGQYSGFFFFFLVAALLDTVCGFAAATVSGRVLASHFSVNCIAPAVGQVFLACGKVVKAGRKQVFVSGELYADSDGKRQLVATGSAILVPVETPEG